jgi:hypothetical protein
MWKWRQQRTALAKLVASATGLMLLASCSSEPNGLAKLAPQTLRRFETHFQLPKEASKLTSYSRVYALAPPNTAPEEIWLFGDVGEGIDLPTGRAYGVGVYIRKQGLGREAQRLRVYEGVRIVTIGELPRLLHGGCSVVNIVFDPVTGRTIGSWCNGDDPSPRAA